MSDDSRSDIFSQFAPDGLLDADVIQILLNSLVRATKAAYNLSELPRVGIVREIQEIKDTSRIAEIEGRNRKLKKALKQESVRLYSASVEIQNLTEEYGTFLRCTRGMNETARQIEKKLYLASLKKVFIPASQSSTRLPVKNELIFLDYQNKQDPNSVKFNGFPLSNPIIDPDLSSYLTSTTNETKKAFKQDGP